MKSPRWIVPTSIASVAVTAVVTAFVATRSPGFSVIGLLGSIATTAAGVGVAGASHHFAHRLISWRPWGAYLYGILIGEAYLFAIMGVLTVAKLLGAPGLTRPGQTDPFADWHHWPVVAASGVVGGLLWGFLSRNENPIEPDD